MLLTVVRVRSARRFALRSRRFHVTRGARGPLLPHRLELRQNSLGNGMACALAAELEQNSGGLQHITLAKNAIATRGAMALLRAIQVNSVLTNLDLSFNLGPPTPSPAGRFPPSCTCGRSSLWVLSVRCNTALCGVWHLLQ